MPLAYATGWRSQEQDPGLASLSTGQDPPRDGVWSQRPARSGRGPLMPHSGAPEEASGLLWPVRCREMPRTAAANPQLQAEALARIAEGSDGKNPSLFLTDIKALSPLR